MVFAACAWLTTLYQLHDEPRPWMYVYTLLTLGCQITVQISTCMGLKYSVLSVSASYPQYIGACGKGQYSVAYTAYIQSPNH